MAPRKCLKPPKPQPQRKRKESHHVAGVCVLRAVAVAAYGYYTPYGVQHVLCGKRKRGNFSEESMANPAFSAFLSVCGVGCLLRALSSSGG